MRFDEDPTMIRIATRGLRQGGWRAVLLLGLAAALPAAAQDAASTKRDTELREAPGEAAARIKPLPAQTVVTRLPDRSGPWVQVRLADGATGWLHMFDLGPTSGGASTTAPAESSSPGLLRGMTNLLGRGSGASNTTSTSASGIRGLDKADIQRAQPNLAAVAEVEGQRLSEAQAREFAARANLQPVQVEPLPAPLRPTTTPQGDPSQPQQ